MSPFVSIRFLQTQSDARLLLLARRGHERAFEALVHRYRRPLLAHCRRLLGSDARAEDGLQQGLMQAWIALQQGAEVRDVRPWLYRVVHNASLNLIRGRTETAVLEDSLEAAATSDTDVERRLAVRDALASVAALPLLQREALLRTAVDGHSHEQVATALGLTDGAVRGLIYRARATLRAAATAVTPAPVAKWVATAAARPSAPPLAQRIGELAGGGGSAGAAAMLVKGGAAVVTAGAVAAGVAAPVVHLARHSAKPSPAAATASKIAPGAAVNGLAIVPGGLMNAGFGPGHPGRGASVDRGAAQRAAGRAGAGGRGLPGGRGHGQAGEINGRDLAPGLAPLPGGGPSSGSHGGSGGSATSGIDGGHGGTGNGSAQGGSGGSSVQSNDGGSSSTSGGGMTTVSGSSGGPDGGSSTSGGSGSTPGGSGSTTSSGSGSTTSGSGSGTSGGSGSTSGGSGSTSSGGSGSTSSGLSGDGISGDTMSATSGSTTTTSTSDGGTAH